MSSQNIGFVTVNLLLHEVCFCIHSHDHLLLLGSCVKRFSELLALSGFSNLTPLDGYLKLNTENGL